MQLNCINRTYTVIGHYKSINFYVFVYLTVSFLLLRIWAMLAESNKTDTESKINIRTFPVDGAGCGMNASRWSQLAMLRSNAGGL